MTAWLPVAAARVLSIGPRNANAIQIGSLGGVGLCSLLSAN
jgi:hypothetical protein